MTEDCVVIGGGVIGLLTARELVQNSLTVILFERGEIGQEASWAGGGILSPLYPWRNSEAINKLARLSQAQYPSLAEELRQETSIDPEWTPSGCLMLNVADQAEAIKWAAAHSANLQLISSGAEYTLEPALQTARGGAVWMPEIAQVRNPRLVKALKASLLRRGIEIRENCPVRNLLIHNQQILGVETAQDRIKTNQVVLASGAWSAALLEPLGQRLEVIPVRGQMLLFHAFPGLIQHIVMAGPHYLIPRRNGHILVGSTVEQVGFDKSTTQDAKKELREAALTMVPILASYDIEHHWAGLRPGSPAGIPFIGTHPDIRGLYVNTGHYRNGITLAPASARLLVDLILGRKPAIDPTPYNLEAKRNEQ